MTIKMMQWCGLLATGAMLAAGTQAMAQRVPGQRPAPAQEQQPRSMAEIIKALGSADGQEVATALRELSARGDEAGPAAEAMAKLANDPRIVKVESNTIVKYRDVRLGSLASDLMVELSPSLAGGLWDVASGNGERATRDAAAYALREALYPEKADGVGLFIEASNAAAELDPWRFRIWVSSLRNEKLRGSVAIAGTRQGNAMAELLTQLDKTFAMFAPAFTPEKLKTTAAGSEAELLVPLMDTMEPTPAQQETSRPAMRWYAAVRGTDGLPALIHVVQTSKTFSVKESAEIVIASLGAEAVEPLLKAEADNLKKPAGASIFLALHRITDQDAVPVLLKHVDDENPEIRRLVIYEFADLMDGRSVHALIKAMKDPDPEVRVAAIVAAAKNPVSNVALGPAVEVMLKDPSARVRKVAAEDLLTFSRTDDEAVATALKQAEGDADQGVRDNAQSALENLKPKGVH